MPERSLHFEDITLNQALGIRMGEGFKLDELSPCSNVIHGRNGSGKTTTARVIQELMWPGNAGLGRATISGVMREGDRLWESRMEPGHYEWRLNGVTEAGPELGPPEFRRRYMLSLVDLVTGNDEEFAQVIADQTLGGFNLEGAVERCAFMSPPGARKAAQALKAAEENLRNAQHRQVEIQSEESQRRTLLEAEAEARAATERLPQLERALEYREARRRCEELRARLESFPPEIASLRGDERETLDRTRAELIKARAELGAAERSRSNAQAEKTAAGIADAEQAASLLSRVKARLPRLLQLETDTEQEERALAEARGQAGTLRGHLGNEFTDEQLRAMAAVELPELSDFTRKVIALNAERRVHAERLEALRAAPDAQAPEHELATIHNGIQLLREWLTSPEDESDSGISQRLPFVISLALVAAAGVYLGLSRHPAWFTALFIPVGLWWWDATRKRKDDDQAEPAGNRSLREADYRRTGLPAPAEWTSPAVAEQLRQLTDLALRRRAEDERLGELRKLEAETARLREREQELSGLSETIREKLGLRIEISDEWLPRFIDNLSAWQQKCAQAAGLESRLEHLRADYRELLEGVNGDLTDLGLPKVDSHEAAALRVNEFEARLNRHREAAHALSDAERELAAARSAIERAESAIAEIHERLGVGPEREHQIDLWLGQRPNYLALREQLQEAEIIRDQRQRDLAGFEPAPDEDLETAIAEAREASRQWSEIRDRITRIDLRIAEAKAGHELSDALAARDRARAELREILAGHCRQAAGQRLADWVGKKASQGARPQVFHRARELFLKFTQNRLRLDMDDRAKPPCFLARRSETSADPVSRLSVGERIQLLIAVQLAFIELNESIRLPLVLDEVLGSTDDERAMAIIDTVVAIAREGRQVFYFTAQLDEVEKWRARLKAANVHHQVIDLDRVRDESVPPARRIPTTPIAIDPAPRPDGADYHAYGVKLGVRKIDPWDENASRLHPWHVFDDVDLLYRALRHRYTSWWQLKNMPAAEREQVFPRSAEAFRRAEARARAIEIACRAWRVGRGRPVTREVIVNSGVVSDTFLDDVARLAEEERGSGDAIIAGLRNRRISGWRNRKTDELQAYFEAHGYLDDGCPLKRAQILHRVETTLVEERMHGLLEPEEIQRIVAELPEVED